MKFGVGQTVKRVEDASLLIGKGNYTDDQMPGYGMAVAFLRSPFAHAKLTYLDLSAARTSDGVHLAAGQAEMDADNVGEIHCQQYVENRDGSQIPRTTKPAMVRDIIRHAGDIVAMVVADTRQQALDAIELIDVDYALWMLFAMFMRLLHLMRRNSMSVTQTTQFSLGRLGQLTRRVRQ